MFVGKLSENESWKPYTYSLDVLKGSVMDFSSLVPRAGAGEKGWIVARAGELVFESEPTERLRFYGVNICFGACFPETKEDCDRFCDNLLRYGYNSIRLHHYDIGLVCKDFEGHDFVNSYTFNEEHLDQFDYLFAALKKRGIYISTDLYTTRPFKAEEVPEYGRDGRMEIKTLIPLYDSAISAWSRFAVNLFEHVNPYTGLAYKDDPALFSLCLVNEDTLLHRYAAYPEIKELYLQRFEKWLKGQGPANKPGDDTLLGRFLSEMQINANRKMIAVLRGLGVKALITSANYWDLIATTEMRDDFDYIDTHVYWDHPEFLFKKGGLPYDHHQQMDVERMALTFRTVNCARKYDTPFMLTEFNDVFPNHYRAEGGPLFGAYMALQDWDGAYRFDFANSRVNTLAPVSPNSWAIASDPIGLLSDKIVTLMFGRGDVSAAKNSYAYLVDPEELFSSNCLDNYALGGFPLSLGFIGLLSKVGYVSQNNTDLGEYALLINRHKRPDGLPEDLDVRVVPERAADPAIAAAAPTPSFAYTIDESVVDEELFAEIGETQTFSPKTGRITSDTGEIVMNASGKSLKVVTPRIESFVLPGDTELAGSAVKVVSDNFCVVAVASTDEESIARTHRLLILHLSDIQPTGAEYTDGEHTRITSLGTLPHLVRSSEAEITIEHEAAQSAQIWSVDTSGKRLEEIPFTVSGSKISFTAKTTGYTHTTMTYEIIFKGKE